MEREAEVRGRGVGVVGGTYMKWFIWVLGILSSGRTSVTNGWWTEQTCFLWVRVSQKGWCDCHTERWSHWFEICHQWTAGLQVTKQSIVLDVEYCSSLWWTWWFAFSNSKDRDPKSPNLWTRNHMHDVERVESYCGLNLCQARDWRDEGWDSMDWGGWVLR